MKNAGLCTAALAVILTCVGAVPSTNDPSAVRKAVEAFECDLNTAIVTHDVARMQYLLDPGFANSDVNGLLRSRAFVVAQPVLKPKDVVSQIAVDSILIRPHVLVVHGHTTYLLHGRRLFADRFTDVLDRDGDHLRDLAAQETIIESHSPPKLK